MIQVIDNSTGQVLNDFPTVKAVARFCEGEPDLWRYSFLDTRRMKYISWVQVERLINKDVAFLGRLKNEWMVVSTR